MNKLVNKEKSIVGREEPVTIVVTTQSICGMFLLETVNTCLE